MMYSTPDRTDHTDTRSAMQYKVEIPRLPNVNVAKTASATKLLARRTGAPPLSPAHIRERTSMHASHSRLQCPQSGQRREPSRARLTARCKCVIVQARGSFPATYNG